MADTIKSTSDYDKFLIHEFNRDVFKTAGLEASMRKHGWISAYPMHVTKAEDGKMKIKAGHHRFTVARKLGIPAKYVVCEDSTQVTIQELETSTMPWSLRDYLTSFYRLGNPHYAAVKKYHELTGIPLTESISLVGGHAAGSHNFLHKFKTGTFKCGDQTHANQVLHIVLALKSESIKIASTALFVQAISKILWVPEFNSQTFIDRASKNKALMIKQQSLAAYIGLIEQVYNYSSKKGRLALAFMADKAAKERNAVKRA